MLQYNNNIKLLYFQCFCHINIIMGKLFIDLKLFINYSKISIIAKVTYLKIEKTIKRDSDSTDFKLYIS